jgi:hypothetical protein
MRNVWFAFLIVLFAVLVTKTGGSSDNTGGQNNGQNNGQNSGRATNATIVSTRSLLSRGGVYCTVLANAVKADSAGKRVLAGGRFRCDRPGPDSLTMTVSLQKRGANGAWATVASQRFGSSGAATTRDVNDAARTRELAVNCAPGTYRTVINGSSVSEKKTRTYAMTSPSANDPCTRLRARR